MAKRNFQLNSDKRIVYGKNVVQSILVLAAKEITGVSSLVKKGVSFTVSSNTLNVEVYFAIEYGYSVSDVAYRVQESIKRSIETMTHYKVGTVNVSVLGVAVGDGAAVYF